MKRLSVRYYLGVSLFVVGLALSACAPGQGEPLLPTPTSQISIPDAGAPTATASASAPLESPSTPQPQADPRWVVFNDEFWGYSFAVPCWWPIIPAPQMGVASSTTIASYDEAYFMANSVKGGWLGGAAPLGAVKMDLTTMLISATADTHNVLKNSLTGGMPELVNSIEEVTLGTNQALMLIVRSEFDPGETHTLYAFRPTPDRLFVVSVYPETAAGSRDVQVILESLSFSSDRPVLLPSGAPSSPLISVPQVCAQPNIIGAP